MGGIRTSSYFPSGPRIGGIGIGGFYWKSSSSPRSPRDDPTYIPRAKAAKHDILEEVTDNYRWQLASEAGDGKQRRRVSVRKPVSEALASDRMKFLNQPSKSGSSSSGEHGTIIYSQPGSDTCPEVVIGFLSLRESNLVLWKKYFVVLDSGTLSMFKQKKAPPMQAPYGEILFKSISLNSFKVSLTDKSVKDDNGNIIPCKLYLTPMKVSTNQEEEEEMVFRSTDISSNEVSLEEWADAFNAHILYDIQKMTFLD